MCMYKAYQMKWCFILAGIFSVSTLFLRPESFNNIQFWEYLDYIFRISLHLIVCWVIHAFFLVNKIPKVSNSTRFLLSNLTAIFATIALSFLFYSKLPHTHFVVDRDSAPTIRNFFNFFFGGFVLSVICYGAFYSIHSNFALQNSKIENEVLKQAHLHAQLLSLQQQISPHFLFNSLSTLKTIANDQPTKNYIVQLASVYRYVLNFNQHYLTPLEDELTFIKSYIYIMNQRFETSLQVLIEITEDKHLKLMIPPLSLQLLVENAIKHNMISPEQPLYISIKTDHTPSLIVENNFRPKKIVVEGTGTGLKNISERYRLLGNTTIRILNEEGIFSVTLPLLQK